MAIIQKRRESTEGAITRLRVLYFWNILVAVCFTLVTSLPVIMLISSWNRSTLEFENRLTAPWPKLLSFFTSADERRGFTSRFEAAFNDRFGGRDSYIRLHNTFEAVAFRKSSTPRVVIGKGNWLYVSGNWSTIAADQVPYPRETNISIARGIERRAKVAKEIGAEYRLLYSPDKHTIYPEHIPNQLRVAAQNTRIDEVLSLLPADVRRFVVDLRQPLLEEKRERQVYFATDSHWNFFGARVGFKGLLSSLGLPADQNTAINDYRTETYVGDLARMLGATVYFNEIAPIPLISAASDGCRQEAAIDLVLLSFECTQAPSGRMVVYRDSFGIPLIERMKSMYRRTDFIANGFVFDEKWIRKIRPAAIVDQMVERNLPNLAIRATSLEKLSIERVFHDIAHSFSCDVQEVSIDENGGHPNRIFRLLGKINGQELRPERIWVALEGESSAFIAEVEPFDSGLVHYFGARAVDPSAFQVVAEGDELTQGIYHVAIITQSGASMAKCATSAVVKIVQNFKSQ